MKTYNIHGFARIFRPWEFHKYNFWPVNFAVHRCCFCFREGGLSSYIVKLVRTFLSFWVLEKHVRLDPCTWGLPHLSLRVAELGAPGNLGHLDFRVRKEEANF